MLVRVELDGFLLLLYLHGYDLLGEQALLRGLLGPLVATRGVLVNFITAQAILIGDVLGRHAHVVVVEDVPQPVVDHVIQNLGVR